MIKYIHICVVNTYMCVNIRHQYLQVKVFILYMNYTSRKYLELYGRYIIIKGKDLRIYNLVKAMF